MKTYPWDTEFEARPIPKSGGKWYVLIDVPFEAYVGHGRFDSEEDANAAIERLKANLQPKEASP